MKSYGREQLVALLGGALVLYTIVSSSQRRALQQLTAFAGDNMPAALETAAMDLDFSACDERKNTEPDPRSNSRSKPFQIQ
jgi:hypothetical protein